MGEDLGRGQAPWWCGAEEWKNLRLVDGAKLDRLLGAVRALAASGVKTNAAVEPVLQAAKALEPPPGPPRL